MKQIIISILIFSFHQTTFAQDLNDIPKLYLGVSYGTSYSIGNFKDTDVSNPDAGFAKNGKKLDIYGGRPLSEKTTLTFGFRYQTFDTEIEDLIENYNTENPGANFSGITEDWQTYYFLVGMSYQVNITKKIDFFPRIGMGPLFVNNPGMSISSPNSTFINNFVRSSETGFGLVYELGIGFQRDLGKHFAFMPTFTFSGGLITIPDVIITTDNVSVISDYQPQIQSFNLGLSLAYKIY
jgi:hypothetical protein